MPAFEREKVSKFLSTFEPQNDVDNLDGLPDLEGYESPAEDSSKRARADTVS